jgi:hypothetical protein
MRGLYTPAVREPPAQGVLAGMQVLAEPGAPGYLGRAVRRGRRTSGQDRRSGAGQK